MAVEDFGKRLWMEVEEVGLDEILNDVRLQQDAPTFHFGLPQLDGLVQGMLDSLDTRPGNMKASTSPPIVELMSQHACSGKTQLLCHLTALAVLPGSLGGRQTAVLYFDLDNHFYIPRLAQQIHRLALAHSHEARKKLSTTKSAMNTIITESLRHVQIYRPHTLAKTVSALNNLPSYLFNASAHHSFDRAIAFIAIDSVSRFHWQARAGMDEAASLDSTSESACPPQSIGYTHLAAALKSASRALATPVIYTARDYNPPSKALSSHHSPFSGLDELSYRPSLPPPFNAQNFTTLRLMVRKASVGKLPVEVSVEDARREEESKRRVIEQGRVECFVNEWGVEERVMERLRKKGERFEFFATVEGIKVGDGPE